MKKNNKKIEQEASKQSHKKPFKAKNRTEPNLNRPIAKLIEKPLILIVCEGKNTEPSYFNQFRLSFATIKTVGEGFNTTSLVNRAKELKCEKHYDQIWCVFDKDDFSDNDFNLAIHLANKLNFYTAYSNQAFEYWLILHFDDHQGGGMARKDYNDKLNELLSPFNITFNGYGDKKINEKLFELLNGLDVKTNKRRIDLAINRAKRNYHRFDHLNPAKEESSTTVFKLAEELLKHT